MNRRQTVLLCAIACLWICGGLIAFLNLREAREAYIDTHTNLEQMQGMVIEIKQLRVQASTAQLIGEQPKQTIQPWVERASRVGIAQPSNFVGSPLQPIAKSEYSQESVTLTLPDVTLQQTIKFLTELNDSSEYVPTVVDLRASSTSSSTALDERWTANLVLTRLIYTAINQSGDL
jgi:hypothetical protein